jgi:magnesium transporter
LKIVYRGENALPSIESYNESTSDNVTHAEPWLELESLIVEADKPGLVAYLEDTSTGEKARAISRLNPERQQELFTLLPSEAAAELVDEISDAQAAQLLDPLPASDVAAIADHLPSDEQADLLNCFDPDRAEVILEHMQPDESADARLLRVYPKDSAGGLMVTEFLICDESNTVGEVLSGLRDRIDEYEDYDVQYLYVVSPAQALTGVLPLRSLVLSRIEQRVADLMVHDPLSISVDTPLDELDDFFQRHAFFGVPVTGEQQQILGVVRRADVVEARAEWNDEKLRRFSGVLGGEEFRTMPVYLRSLRRMIWLSLTVILNLISASVIGLYQDTLNEIIALAVFLPVISGMGGSSGNQAIAVSMRELTLGLVKPHEMRWVMLKELTVGAINGVLLGTAIGCVAWLWKGNVYLGLVVGSALALSNVIAVCVGGGLPLLLQRAKVDAALVAGPVLMTLADACGFFFALSFASMLLQRLV